MSAVADLDAPARSLTLLHSIDPNNMVFLHRGQTRVQLANALAISIYNPLQPATRVLLLTSEVGVILTLIVCFVMLYKKKTLGKLRLVTKRASRSGTFYLTNSVLILVVCVCGYLIAFDITCIMMTAFSYANISSLECYWVIPLPWLPLIIGAYVGMHGFAVGCSPRSPLSTMNRSMPGNRIKWYHLPITRSATASNIALVLPCVLLFVNTVTLCVMSGHSYYRAKHFAQQTLPTDWLRYMREHAANRPSVLVHADLPASDELIWMARTVAASYYETLRYACINLAVYAACAYALFIPSAAYGIPTVISLVDHACSRHSEHLSASGASFHHKLWFLVTKGKPTSEQSTTHLSLASWKMTILATIYVFLVVGSIPLFGFVPIFVIALGFPHGIRKGSLSPMLRDTLWAICVINIIACTLFAVFCVLATHDPVFRAAIGLNIRRSYLAGINSGNTNRIEYEEKISVSIATDGGNEGKLTLHEMLAGPKRPPMLVLRPSTSTLNSTLKPSPTSSEFRDIPVYPKFTVEANDVESAYPRETWTGKRRGDPTVVVSLH